MISDSKDVSEFYDEMAKFNDYDEFWAYDRILYEQIHPILIEYIEKMRKHDSLILDLGCGTGAQTLILCRKGFRRVYGLDISKGLLKIAKIKTRKFDNAPFLINADAATLPFKDETFDLLVCFYNVLNHVLRYDFAIKEMYRVLKKGGHMLLEIEKVSMSDLFYGGLDILLGGILDYEMTLNEWLTQLKHPFHTMTPRWTYKSKQIRYWRFSTKVIENECQNAGFKIIHKYGISIISGLLPWGLLKKSSSLANIFCPLFLHLDKNIKNLRIFRNLGLNTVYVMEKQSD